MQKIRIISLLTFLSALVVCTGCGKAERHAENEIAKALQQRLAPAKAYNVNITGAPLKLLKGKMERLDIVGNEVHLSNGVTLANLNVSVYDLVFDPDTKEIKRASKTEYSAKISQGELTRYLHKMYPDVQDLKISMREGYIDVSARPTVAGVGVNVKTEADVRVEDHHLLILDLKKISAAGVTVPEIARNYIEEKVNPILDSRDLGFNATVNSLKLAKGSISVAGRLDLVENMQQ